MRSKLHVALKTLMQRFVTNFSVFNSLQVNKTSSSIRVIATSRNSTLNNIPRPASETQMLRLLSSAAQKREVKATQNLSIIVAFFMICWIPLYTINCINAFCRECFINETLIYFGIILSHLNSAINPLLYAYHLKDFRGALVRLFTCAKNDQESNFRPSQASQMQNRVTSQINQRMSFRPRVYIDSPVWKHQQRQLPLEVMSERKINDVDSGFGKWEPELSSSPPSLNHNLSEFQNNFSSQATNKIFVIGDSHHLEPEQPTSSLYRIVQKSQEVNPVDK